MADYPSGIYSPRTKNNKDGVVYDAGEDTTLFAEDVVKDDAEIVAIETELGTNPKGTKASVKARLDDIDSRGLVLSATPLADGAYSGIVEVGVAGEEMGVGHLVYFDDVNSYWIQVDANVASGYDKKLGICILNAASEGDPTLILLYGKVRKDSMFPTLSIGAPVYISETQGLVVVAQPTTSDVCIRIVGFGNTADELFFCPSPDYIVHV